jgi:hypothetical protein
MWQIETIVDHGPQQFYRYSITGTNMATDYPSQFCWAVPSIADERYTLSPTASAEASVAFAKSKANG